MATNQLWFCELDLKVSQWSAVDIWLFLLCLVNIDMDFEPAE